MFGDVGLSGSPGGFGVWFCEFCVVEYPFADPGDAGGELGPRVAPVSFRVVIGWERGRGWGGVVPLLVGVDAACDGVVIGKAGELEGFQVEFVL